MEKLKTHNKNKQYLWWKDKKIFGVMLLLTVLSFQIFAFLEVPFLTTIHGYTVGMLFGFYNPLFYFFMAYIALLLITNNKLHLPKWIKFKWSTYWIIVISIVFISASTGYYQVKNGWLSIGSDSWLAFDKWFIDFTLKNNAWFPVNTNGGFIGVFLYSFFAMMFTGIGALVIAILSILVPVSLLWTGSILGLHRKIRRKKMLSNRNKKAINKKTKFGNYGSDNNDQTELGITFEGKSHFGSSQNDGYGRENSDQDPEDKNDLPFDDPFG